MEQLKSFSQYILQIGNKYGLHSVFEDFLEIVVCALSLGAKESRYHEIVRNYEKPDAYLMADFRVGTVKGRPDSSGRPSDAFSFMDWLIPGGIEIKLTCTPLT